MYIIMYITDLADTNLVVMIQYVIENMKIHRVLFDVFVVLILLTKTMTKNVC